MMFNCMLGRMVSGEGTMYNRTGHYWKGTFSNGLLQGPGEYSVPSNGHTAVVSGGKHCEISMTYMHTCTFIRLDIHTLNVLCLYVRTNVRVYAILHMYAYFGICRGFPGWENRGGEDNHRPQL
jgi:hypothetical protein